MAKNKTNRKWLITFSRLNLCETALIFVVRQHFNFVVMLSRRRGNSLMYKYDNITNNLKVGTSKHYYFIVKPLGMSFSSCAQ